MPLTSDDTIRHLQNLAILVAQRRASLGFSSKEAAADACGIAHMTYRKIEGTKGVLPQRVTPATYKKVEAAFGIRHGDCVAVADGRADSITLEDGTELVDGAKIVQLDAEALQDGMPDAVSRSAMVVAPELTGRQIKEMSDRIVEDLRRRGLLP